MSSVLKNFQDVGLNSFRRLTPLRFFFVCLTTGVKYWYEHQLFVWNTFSRWISNYQFVFLAFSIHVARNTFTCSMMNVFSAKDKISIISFQVMDCTWISCSFGFGAVIHIVFIKCTITILPLQMVMIADLFLFRTKLIKWKALNRY